MELWQILFGISGTSLATAFFMSKNRKSSGSFFSFSKGEIRLSDKEAPYDFQNSSQNSKAGKFDHLFGSHTSQNVGNMSAIKDDSSRSEVRLQESSSLVDGQDIPKLSEYRGEFDKSSAIGNENNNLNQKPKAKDNAWTPMSFFSKD